MQDMVPGNALKNVITHGNTSFLAMKEQNVVLINAKLTQDVYALLLRVVVHLFVEIGYLTL